MTLLDFVQTIAGRRSLGPKLQTREAPSAETLERAALAARSAPCHAEDFPCRLVSVASREKLANLFEAALPADANDAQREKARSKALKGAACIAVIAPAPTGNAVVDMENLMTAGGALTNFLNVLWAEGVAAKTVSGRRLADPQGLYNPETERLLCFVLCGLSKEAMTPRKPAPSILTTW